MTRRKLNEDQVKAAVANSTNIKEVLIQLQIAPSGGNYGTIRRWIKKLALDISHFVDRRIGNKPTFVLSNEEIFIIQGTYSRSKLKARIIRDNLIPYKCEQCGLIEWQGKKLSLHLDHINGVRDDNRLENLRFLCPNCHSLTETYCGKANRLPPKLCVDCGIEIIRTHKRCLSCTKKAQLLGLINRPTKIIWPTNEQLEQMIIKTSQVATAKQLGVSASALRKHLQKSNTN